MVDGENQPLKDPPEPPELTVKPGRLIASAAAGTLDPYEPIPIDDPKLGYKPLPDKFTEFRPNQWQAIVEAIEHLENGVKVVMISAPTGTGKTLIAETIRRLWQGGKPTSIVCTTKTLQAQIVDEFDYAKEIKGRSNYPTSPPVTFADCGDCTGSPELEYNDCDFCTQGAMCPYLRAKEAAAEAPMSVLNTAYFLNATRSPKSAFRDRRLTVFDEADTLEDQLMGFIEIKITPRLRKDIGVATMPKKTVEGDWQRWLTDEVMPALSSKIKQLGGRGAGLFTDADQVKRRRAMKRYAELYDHIRIVLKDDDPFEGWVLTGKVKSKDSDITFKPIRVAEYARELLWQKADQFVLMSATMISPAQMAEDLGLQDHEWEAVTLDSTFPPENRTITLTNTASLTYKTKAEAQPKIRDEINNIMDSNPGSRILIHTVSYELTRFLYDTLPSGRLHAYFYSREREKTLKRFLDSEDGVLLAPSFERGVDLPGEDCEVIVIAKTPYPFLGDDQIKARLYAKGGKSWYAVQTIRSIVQMTGRGMRSADDWCDTYILDSQFKRLLRDSGRLVPGWWKEALIRSETDPKYRELREARDLRQSDRLESWVAPAGGRHNDPVPF